MATKLEGGGGGRRGIPVGVLIWGAGPGTFYPDSTFQKNMMRTQPNNVDIFLTVLQRFLYFPLYDYFNFIKISVIITSMLHLKTNSEIKRDFCALK